MRFDDALGQLRDLPTPLPAGPARIEPSVLERGLAAPGMVVNDKATRREAAALVLLYPDAAGVAHIVLTVRPDGDHVHAGQVALPGGKREASDAWPVGTALREASEEVGLDAAAAGVETLGLLDSVNVRVSGFLMVPVLAVARSEPALVADEREVARLLCVPVAHFLPGAPVEMVDERRGGWHLRYGAYPVDGHRVWGATARVLGQLGAILEPAGAGYQGSPSVSS